MDDLSAYTASDQGRIFDSILDTIGNTPLVRLRKLAEETGCQTELLGKCEFFNPLSSVKDRIGLAMVLAAESEGLIGKDAVLVEPTSGNTGIALAFVCARRDNAVAVRQIRLTRRSTAAPPLKRSGATRTAALTSLCRVLGWAVRSPDAAKS